MATPAALLAGAADSPYRLRPGGPPPFKVCGGSAVLQGRMQWWVGGCAVRGFGLALCSLSVAMLMGVLSGWGLGCLRASGGFAALRLNQPYICPISHPLATRPPSNHRSKPLLSWQHLCYPPPAAPAAVVALRRRSSRRRSALRLSGR